MMPAAIIRHDRHARTPAPLIPETALPEPDRLTVPAPLKADEERSIMAYWLFKSEPRKWSWDMQKQKGRAGEQWDGVRNYQARNNMRAMKHGDKGFFYHSNEGLEIVGIVEVAAEAHQDTTTQDCRWQCVDIRAVCDMPQPVSLKRIRENPELENMALVRSMRLSVQPVTADEWQEVCRMGGLVPAP